jgi:hypothetical protein
VALEPEPRCLKNCRDCRAHDVFAMHCTFSMAACGECRAALLPIAVEDDFEQSTVLCDVDFGNANVGVRLAMARELADALLWLVVKDEYLLIAPTPQDRPSDGCIGNDGRADLWLPFPVSAREDDAIEGNLRSGLAGYVAVDNVALGDTILFAAGFNYRVHGLGYDSNP